MAKKKDKKEKRAERAAAEAAAKAAAEAAAAEAARLAAEAEAAEAARLAALISNPPPVPLRRSEAKKLAKALREGEYEVKQKKRFVYVPPPASEKPALDNTAPTTAADRPAPKTFAARLLVGKAAKAASTKLTDDKLAAARGNRPLL